MEGWVKLHRGILNWEWWEDQNAFRLFLYCLLKANHKDKKWQGKLINRGSFITGIHKLSSGTGLSQQQTRTAIEKLKSTGEITIQATNQYSTITISNYEKYQVVEEGKQQAKQQTDDKRITNEQQTKQQTDNYNQESKEVENVKNEKNINTTIGSEIEISGTHQENFEESNKNKKEKKKKTPPKKKKTIITDMTSPLPRTEENRHLRLAYTIWHLLKPHHGERIPFNSAILENWGTDIMKLMKHDVKSEFIYELVQWTLINKPDSIPFFQSPNHLVKNEFKNFSFLTALKEASEKKAQTDKNNTKANNSTPKKYKIFKPDNV